MTCSSGIRPSPCGPPAQGHPLAAALAEQGALPEKTVVGVRPEDIQVFAARPGSDALPAEVSVIEPLGGETIVDLLVGPDIIKAIVPPAQQLSEGQAVWIKFDPDQIHLFDATSGCVATRRGRRPGFECAGRVACVLKSLSGFQARSAAG